MRLSEDDLYRSSTQCKHWSFTTQQIAAQRRKTNMQAAERVKANVARQRAQRLQQAESDSVSSGVENASGATTPLPDRGCAGAEVDCLTAGEELTIVNEFCERALQLGAHCQFPIEVTATCIQFLRRFYLYQSPMSYHLQNISRTAMFLACKTENSHQSVETFSTNFKKVTPEQVLAPEYLIVQALRFNFQVRHPFRGLKGGHLELMEMARGSYEGPNCIDEGMTSADLQVRMLQLPSKKSAAKQTVQDMEKRITDAYGFASHILKNAALLTDAYFLYTPSQIWLASHLLADESLTLFYLSLKVPTTSPLHTKIIDTLRSCASLLSSHPSLQATVLPKAQAEAQEATHKAEVKRVIEKLKSCRDPDKVDLVKLNQAQKRDAVAEGGLEEHKAKRRKVERETYEKASDDFWGPELGKTA
ncbi:cyclin-like protein [Ampelomyces quisqualis]|uniref:RNA polymerase II holoenzyme cyclin-like subunit n=1 Tax=Ampelomyces quisqualis TaxID=50730 RepID=A0A6A5QHZ5_AMPQU|nr:cyclin-like protein [Ampelomyces quisqualis]